MIDRAHLERYVTDSRRRFEDLLGQMVEIPSISMDPAKAPDIRRMAEFARQVLTGLGAEAQIVETGGYPIVSGGWTTGAHHPTVTIYNHMDVQPAQELEWTQAPFAFKNENGLYRGRGATDVRGLGRIHADRRNLHHLTQQIFIPSSAVRDVTFKVRAIDHE